MRIHKFERPACVQCGKSFITRRTLNVHMRIHTGVKPYNCTWCNVAFRHMSSLQAHELTHSAEKPHKCTQCNAAFRHVASMIHHMKTHTGEKPHECTYWQVCSASFISAQQLGNHIRAHHTGERLFKCDKCESAFKQSGNLQIHQRIHTGEKPYKCHMCDYACAQKNNLTRHLKNKNHKYMV